MHTSCKHRMTSNGENLTAQSLNIDNNIVKYITSFFLLLEMPLKYLSDHH